MTHNNTTEWILCWYVGYKLFNWQLTILLDHQNRIVGGHEGRLTLAVELTLNYTDSQAVKDTIVLNRQSSDSTTGRVYSSHWLEHWPVVRGFRIN